MTKSAPLVFFGNERLSSGFKPQGAPTLEALIDAGHSVAAVVANFETGTSRRARELEIATVAKKHGIPLLLPAELSTIYSDLADLKATAAVLVAYGRIIPQSIIDLFPRGILNIHPSLLPRYRGPTPIEQAMLDGATQTGVSIMRLVKKMDAGPIYAQQSVTLLGTETKQALTERLLQLGGELLLETLPNVLAGKLTPAAQNESKATYTSLIQKSDGIIDWRKPALQLEREVRAYATWPKSHAALFGQSIVITEARVARDQTDGALVMPCTPGWLEITQLIAPSGKTMNGADFIRGYKK